MKLVHARYVNADGRDEYQLFPKGEEPDEITVNGKVYRRAAVSREFAQPVELKKTVMPFVSYQLPKWWPYAPKHDAKGRCIFNGRKEAIEACARARAAGEPVSWDY